MHQQVQREVLLAVARGHAPDVVLLVRVVLERLQHGGLAVQLLDLRVQRQAAVIRLQEDELVDQERRHQRA